MAGSLNEVTLIGNVGQDPEVRSMGNGKEVASFTLATSESWKDQSGERKEATEWHRCVVFSEGLIRVISNYVKKGSKLMIRGKLKTRKWTDQSGQEKYSTEIVLQGFDAKLVMLDSKGDGKSSEGRDNTAQYGYQAPQKDFAGNTDGRHDLLDQEIPF